MTERCECCDAPLPGSMIEGLERLKWRAETGNRWNWLTPRMRDIIVLVGRDGMTYGEVAAALGISEHTVVEHIRRIMERTETTGKRRDTLVALYHEEIEVVSSPEPHVAGKTCDAGKGDTEKGFDM